MRPTPFQNVRIGNRPAALDLTMDLAGCPSIRDITRDALEPAPARP